MQNDEFLKIAELQVQVQHRISFNQNVHQPHLNNNKQHSTNSHQSTTKNGSYMH